ncbi:hypothetical protein F5Y13DRAFT_166115 [Hypoxylon sp. FL1857]|nr:hypothetical protein F5Y13DRAFT_166115 [Hypoxylon sp. FL1857]
MASYFQPTSPEPSPAKRSAPMDMSPFAIFESPSLIFIYCLITVYLCVCATLGLKIAQTRLKAKTYGIFPRWLCVTVVAIALTIIIIIFLIPFAFAVGSYTLFNLTVKDWCLQFRRGETVDDGRSSWARNNGSGTTMDGVHGLDQSEHLPSYNRHHQDVRIDADAEISPGPPPPAYFPGLH